MKKTKNRTKKPSINVKDLSAKNDPKGGGKKKKGQQEFLVIKMNDVIITG